MNLNAEDIHISQSDFDTFVASQVDFLKSRLKEKPDSLMPYLAVKTVDMKGKEGLTLAAIASGFNENAEKRWALRMLGRKTYEQQEIPLVVALCSEAWVATNPPKGTEPRHCENKREVGVVAAVSIDHRTKIVSIPVRRDGQNRMEMVEDTVVIGGNSRFPLLDQFFHGFFAAVTEASL